MLNIRKYQGTIHRNKHQGNDCIHITRGLNRNGLGGDTWSSIRRKVPELELKMSQNYTYRVNHLRHNQRTHS